MVKTVSVNPPRSSAPGASAPAPPIPRPAASSSTTSCSWRTLWRPETSLPPVLKTSAASARNSYPRCAAPARHRGGRGSQRRERAGPASVGVGELDPRFKDLDFLTKNSVALLT